MAEAAGAAVPAAFVPLGPAQPSFAVPLYRCRLQDAYLDALERCGGLHEARPKTLLDMLQPRFPYLTLQARGRGSRVGGVWRVLGNRTAVPAVTASASPPTGICMLDGRLQFCCICLVLQRDRA